MNKFKFVGENLYEQELYELYQFDNTYHLVVEMRYTAIFSVSNDGTVRVEKKLFDYNKEADSWVVSVVEQTTPSQPKTV